MTKMIWCVTFWMLAIYAAAVDAQCPENYDIDFTSPNEVITDQEKDKSGIIGLCSGYTKKVLEANFMLGGQRSGVVLEPSGEYYKLYCLEDACESREKCLRAICVLKEMIFFTTNEDIRDQLQSMGVNHSSIEGNRFLYSLKARVYSFCTCIPDPTPPPTVATLPPALPVRASPARKQCPTNNPYGWVCCEPIYKTLDGQTIKYSGTCRYNLASSVDFWIEGANERFKRSSKFSSLSYVEGVYKQQTVRIAKHGVITINSETPIGPANLPVNRPDVTITMEVRGITVSFSNGVCFAYDGDKQAKVYVPQEYAGEMTGMLGNYDGNPANDLITKDGQNVNDDSGGHNLIGLSWKIDPTCVD